MLRGGYYRKEKEAAAYKKRGDQDAK